MYIDKCIVNKGYMNIVYSIIELFEGVVVGIGICFGLIIMFVLSCFAIFKD